MGGNSSKRKGSFDVHKGKTANGAAAGVVAASEDKTTVKHVDNNNGDTKGVQEAMLSKDTNGRTNSLRFIDAEASGENDAHKSERSHSIPVQLHQSPAGLVAPHEPRPPVQEGIQQLQTKEHVMEHPAKRLSPEVPIPLAEMEEIESTPMEPIKLATPGPPVPPRVSPKPVDVPAPPAAPSSDIHAQGDLGDLTVTIEKIEEVSLSKRGSYVTMGERTMLEVPEYAVSEPDSDLGSRILEVDGHSLTDIHESDEVRELTTAEMADEKRRADECPEVSRMESPVALVDEPKTVVTPFSSQSAASLGGRASEDEVDMLQEIEWTHGGDEVAVRGTFSNWRPQNMQRLEKGGFAFSFPVTKTTVYMFNFMVDGAVRTDPDRETMKYYVNDTEEDVHTLCVMD